MQRKFIVNPRSGKGTAEKSLGQWDAFFRRHTGDFDYVLTEDRESAIRATRLAIEDGAEQIVAVGGDGTVNAVVNGFFEGGQPISKQCCLAVGRTGTGSDYFKTVTAGDKTCDWKQLVLEHTVRPVDIGHIHFVDLGHEDRYFANMASVGLVADVVRKKNLAGRSPPLLRYIIPTLGSLFSYRAAPARLNIDGTEHEMNLLTAMFSKGTYAGGGMKFAGGARLDDGLFDVTLFEQMGRFEMLCKLPKLYSGRFEGQRKIHKAKAARIVLRAAAPMPVEFDGEVSGTTDIEVSVVPGAIAVCFPKN